MDVQEVARQIEAICDIVERLSPKNKSLQRVKRIVKQQPDSEGKRVLLRQLENAGLCAIQRH